jgi:GTP cyclohydrolase II
MADAAPMDPWAGAPRPAVRFYRARGRYGFLSNLWPCGLRFEGRDFTSAEHAYQYGKPRDPRVREWIFLAPEPRHAAIAGHHLSVYDVSDGWDDSKRGRMALVVLEKFRQNPALADQLLATGDADLVEDSPDSYWGAGSDGKGKNWLGRTLVATRTILAEARAARARADDADPEDVE